MIPNQTHFFTAQFINHFEDILRDKKIFITAWNVRSSDEYLTELIDICKQNDAIIFHTVEPLQVARIIAANSILEEFEYRDKLIFMCSDQSDTVIAEYHEWCSLNNFTPLKIFLYNVIAHYPASAMLTREQIADNNKTFKNKHFVCLNNSVRLHRVKMVADLYESGLHKKGYISASGDEEGTRFWHNYINYYVEHLPEYPTIERWYNKEKDNLPYLLDCGNMEEAHEKFAVPPKLVPYMVDSNFGIVTETWYGYSLDEDTLDMYTPEAFNNTHIPRRTNCFPSTVFATEKSFKMFSTGMPFVTLAKPNTVKFLSEMGFNVFSDWIDHSYDSIKNNTERHNVAFAEIQRLCSLSLEDWHIIRSEMTEAILHNFDLWTKIYRTDTYKPISPPELLREYLS